jgi:hypothetical protein
MRFFNIRVIQIERRVNEMKKVLAGVFSLLCMAGLVLVTPAAAVTLGYTDITTVPGFTIDYNLDINGSAAAFTIEVDATGGATSSNWYIGAWNLKIYEGGAGPANITAGSIPADWDVTDGDTNQDVQIWGWKRSDGRSGFYYEPSDDFGANSGTAGGIQVVGGNSATFNFNIDNPLLGTVYDYGMPMQVAYFGTGANDKNKFNQISVDLVPEPATMLLLGSGLIGMAMVGRKKLFKKV